ncbi:MAG: shikimate kinase [Acidobacteria bacterium]|nr:shikimate kinase [Acidobacteriota bacterium]
MTITDPLFLVGFMGSGKTTIGALLAEALRIPFVDLDDDIETATGRTIADIFSNDGEARFRDLEHQALLARLSGCCVVALGGGAYTFERNRDALRGRGRAIWLDCPFETALRRVAGFEHRPLARDPEKFKSLFDARHAEYAKADVRVPIESDDPHVTVRDILEALR